MFIMVLTKRQEAGRPGMVSPVHLLNSFVPGNNEESNKPTALQGLGRAYLWPGVALVSLLAWLCRTASGCRGEIFQAFGDSWHSKPGFSNTQLSSSPSCLPGSPGDGIVSP